jgi:shikimate kinase
MKDRLIVIVGFMAAGKTTIAQALAARLNYEAVDLDALIKQRTGSTAREIIERDGEAAFRVVETRVLNEALGSRLEQVISLGGGTWTIPQNRDLICRHDAHTIWLDVPFEVCWQRIGIAGNERPLAREEQQAKSLYVQRKEVYSLAELHIQATAKSITEVVEEIVFTLANKCDETEQPRR